MLYYSTMRPILCSFTTGLIIGGTLALMGCKMRVGGCYHPTTFCCSEDTVTSIARTAILIGLCCVPLGILLGCRRIRILSAGSTPTV